MISAALLACALNVHEVTLNKVIGVESRGDTYAVGVNHYAGPKLPPARSVAEAAARAREFMRRGYRVDLGLMQVTDSNLAALGYTVEDMFDPCKAIAAGGAVLTSCYARAVPLYGEGQPALRAALRCYNTGSFTRGQAYEARYFLPNAVPALVGGIRQAAVAPKTKPNSYTADIAIDFAEVSNVSLVQ
jgi:type IV secretion system protein VirB1